MGQGESLWGRESHCGAGRVIVGQGESLWCRESHCGAGRVIVAKRGYNTITSSYRVEL